MFRICRAEFSHLFRDFQVMAILLGSLAFYSFFYPFPYKAEVVKDIPIVVVDLDKTQLSRTLTRMTQASEAVNVIFQAPDFEAARSWVYSYKAHGVLLIPKGFQRSVLRGEKASVAAHCDAGSFITYKQVFSGIYKAAKTFSAGVEIKRLKAGGMAPDQAMVQRDPLATNFIPLFNPAGGYGSYVVPIVFFLLLQQTFFMGMGMLAGTARERGDLVYFTGGETPVHPLVVVAGKGLAHFSIYAVHSIYCFGIMARVYQFPQRGAFLDCILFMVPFLLAVVFGGLVLASFFKEREVPVFVVLFTALPCMFLSRLSWPVEMIPDYLEKIAMVVPSVPGTEGFIRIFTMGADLIQVRDNYL
ncbi:MAG: ABC transporter permease, partial [Desulfobacterales bacterium]|nr:ABC transporter permease [Desulfobacterales bacterium]